MYHWFFLLEITVVKIMNSLNVCSAHSYLYPQSRFKNIDILSDMLSQKIGKSNNLTSLLEKENHQRT
jgi:hypothetical protein